MYFKTSCRRRETCKNRDSLYCSSCVFNESPKKNNYIKDSSIDGIFLENKPSKNKSIFCE